MDISALDHLITEEEKTHFDEKGFLIVRDAVDSDHLDLLEGIVDTIWAEEKYKGKKDSANVFFPNFVGQHQSCIDLLDNPKVFPKDEPLKYPLGFHQDSGRVNSDIDEVSPRPRISLKVAYWLSDVSE